MMNKIKSKLGLGPMSTEIIEATFEYSNEHRQPLMVIASPNQIDYKGGYVNNWTTREFMTFVETMRKKYPQSNVKICRDHCGPGFREGTHLNDAYQTMQEDVESGFDLIHIDFSNLDGDLERKLEESAKAARFCMGLNPQIAFEIGTEENTGVVDKSPEEIESEVNFFQFCKPEFYVVQTGSLIKEINQAGGFNRGYVDKVSKILRAKGTKLKEHNADYLSKQQIQERKGLVDAMNIAPQLGAVQTLEVLNKCLMYGVDFTEFTEAVYEGGKWKKWLNTNTPENRFLCSTIAGHYHFASDEYKALIAELEKREDIRKSIKEKIKGVIQHYDDN